MAGAYGKINRSEERLKAITEGLTLVEKIASILRGRDVPSQG
jgi:hypothetical protein